MKRSQVIKAWTDEAYRLSLGDSDSLNLPAHPAGTVDLDEDELKVVAGGVSANWYDGCRSIMSCSVLFSDCGSAGGAICY